MRILLAVLGMIVAATGLLLPPIQALLPRLGVYSYYRQACLRRTLILLGAGLTMVAILLGGTALPWIALVIVMVFFLMSEFLLVPRKVIPPLDDPPFRRLSPEGLAQDALVVGLETGIKARAYPLAVLIPHHIINETIEGTPVAATYCPACRSGYVYDPVVQGQRLTFEPVSVYRRNMVMRDRETGSVWQQETGLALMGKYKGERLRLMASEMINWKAWITEHPNTSVCLPPEGYRHPSPLGAVFEKLLDHGPEHLVGPGLHGLDRRLGQHDFVIGLMVGGIPKAYPLEDLKKNRVISDNLGDAAIILVYEQEADRVRAFKWTKAGKDKLSPEAEKQFLSTDRRSTWSINDISTGWKNGMLVKIPVVRQWWLAWSEYHPNSELYQSEVSPRIGKAEK